MCLTISLFLYLFLAMDDLYNVVLQLSFNVMWGGSVLQSLCPNSSPIAFKEGHMKDGKTWWNKRESLT